MVFGRIKLLYCFYSIFILILIYPSLRNIIFVSHDYHIHNSTYQANTTNSFVPSPLDDLHQFLPDYEHQFVQRSSSVYTINDLLNLTKLSKNDSLNPSENPIHLITQWYYEENDRRRRELILVLHMNVINNAITKIHFIQNSDHCTIFNDIQMDKQFPYDLLKSKLFNISGYAILVNLDIFFDETLSLLKYRSLLDKKTVLYLSRYEVDPSISSRGLQCSDERYIGSHDALIFQTPISINVMKELPFELGTWHYEVKILYELWKSNYTVRNTCKSIRTWHSHSSQMRHRLMPAKRYISKENLHLVLRKPEFL